jgi:site-specific DNA-methyltransferase (adenine-specific)
MDTAPFTLEIMQDAPAALHAPPCCGSLDLRLGDCMDVMATFEDGHFDLAIVDPPYGLGKRLHAGGKDAQEGRISASQYRGKEWDVPPGAEYFAELRRVSKHQIIWGGNYFDLPPTRGILIWDKVQPMPTMSFGEMAWTSYDKPMKKIEFAYTNYVEGKGPVSKKIHPTQKPVGLYQRVLSEYTKPGMRVLDTHLGSGSIAIAAHYAGVHLTACEIDAGYYAKAVERIENETRQMDLFQQNTQTMASEAKEGQPSCRCDWRIEKNS